MADNELYLTKGEAKAVREGSNTVDMTDNQMRAMGRAGFGGSDSGLKELIMRLLSGMGSKAGSKLSGIAELMEQARDVTGDNKMVGEEVLTEGTTYDYDVDGNPTTFSFSEKLEEGPPQMMEPMSNKNGGIMKFAPGGNPHLDMSEEAAFEAFSSQPSPSPSNYPTGPSNPFNDDNNTINTSPSSSTTNQNNQDKYNQIVDSAGTGNINMNEIVDFREQSGMDGTDYSEFLSKIKERSGNEAFYDAGFTKGPGEMVENWVKGGGFLGNILKSVLGAGKDAGVAALDKVTDFKEYLSNFGDGVMANQAVEEFSEVQGPLTGENKFRDNYLSGDPLGLYQQFLFEDYKNTNIPQTSIAFQNKYGLPNSIGSMQLSNGGGLFPQMTPEDPLMNSFNKTPLSVLERDNGGVTRQQYMQQYAPKTAAQMLGIVETYDEEGIMGV